MVTIITPTFNRGHLIKHCIDSVINQSYTNWELLIVDDGSTDDTWLGIIPYLNDKRIKYLKVEKGGAPKARNLGLRRAKGEYILFLDSDDQIEKNKLEKHINLFYRIPNLDVSVSRYIINFHSLSKVEKVNTINPTKDLQLDFITKRITWPTHTPIWKKEFLLEEEGFDEKLTSNQDFEFYSRLILRNPKVGYIEEYLSHINNYSADLDKFKIRSGVQNLHKLKNKIKSRNIVRLAIKKSNHSFSKKLRLYSFIYYHLLSNFKTANTISRKILLELILWYFKSGRDYNFTVSKYKSGVYPK